MPESADLRAADALTDLRNAFIEFVQSSRASIADVAQAAAATREWIESVVHRRMRARESAEAALRNAEDDLRRCEADGDEDSEPDCSCERNAVDNAVDDLRNAEGELHRAKEWKVRIEKQLTRYETAARRFERTLQKDGEFAKLFTQRKIDQVASYLARKAPK